MKSVTQCIAFRALVLTALFGHGIYATATSSREAAGASYWGIMELSGNLSERTVTIGNTTGRGFTGLHGDGVLTGTGDADVANWPSTDASGAGFRGGNWVNTGAGARVSVRHSAASNIT